MPAFAYHAVANDGNERRGVVEADDRDTAGALLQGQGLLPMQVDPVPPRSRPTSTADREWWWQGRVPVRVLALHTRQLGTLLRAGVPLLRGLQILARQERHPTMRAAGLRIATAIEGGRSLSEAMAEHPAIFDRLFVNMVRAGEASGALDVVLDRLARFREKRMQLERRVRAALVYPVIVLGVAVAILAALMVFVVPRFTAIFADLLKGAPLPLLTRLVIAASDAVRHHLPWGMGFIAVAGSGVMVAKRHPRVRRALDAMALKLPLLGPLLARAAIVRLCQTLGTLLGSGVPILGALLITRDTCANSRVAGAVMEIHEQVQAGQPVVRPLEQSALFPPLLTSMVEVGEQSGQLPEMLGKVAEVYEEELEAAAAGLSALLEPLLIVFLAVVVGTIVIALFLPIVRIVELLS